MKYPLQKELEQALQESCKLVQSTMDSGNPVAQEIATKYFKAITRINDICVNRNRY